MRGSHGLRAAPGVSTWPLPEGAGPLRAVLASAGGANRKRPERQHPVRQAQGGLLGQHRSCDRVGVGGRVLRLTCEGLSMQGALQQLLRVQSLVFGASARHPPPPPRHCE